MTAQVPSFVRSFSPPCSRDQAESSPESGRSVMSPMVLGGVRLKRLRFWVWPQR